MKDAIFKLRILKILLMEAVDLWNSQFRKADLDQRNCCDGRECACGGQTTRDLWISVYERHYKYSQPNNLTGE